MKLQEDRFLFGTHEEFVFDSGLSKGAMCCLTGRDVGLRRGQILLFSLNFL